jgi:hypothetical protein
MKSPHGIHVSILRFQKQTFRYLFRNVENVNEIFLSLLEKRFAYVSLPSHFLPIEARDTPDPHECTASAPAKNAPVPPPATRRTSGRNFPNWPVSRRWVSRNHPPGNPSNTAYAFISSLHASSGMCPISRLHTPYKHLDMTLHGARPCDTARSCVIPHEPKAA